MTDSSLRYYLPEQTLVLFAHCLDVYHSSKLIECCKDTSEHILGSRTSEDFSAEIGLLGRAMYYGISLSWHKCTPGQAFCSLLPMRFHESPAPAPVRSISPAPRKDLLLLAALYTVLPYFYDKKDQLWQSMVQMGAVLSQEEDLNDQQGNSTSSSQQADALNTAPFSRSIKTFGAASSSSPGSSLVAVLGLALRNSWNHLAADSSTRLSRLLSFLKDLHLLVFLVNSHFLEVPLRVAGLRLASIHTSAPATQVRDTFVYFDETDALVGQVEWIEVVGWLPGLLVCLLWPAGAAA